MKLTFEERCPVCGEDRAEKVTIKEKRARCHMCGALYQPESEDTQLWELLMEIRYA